ncbi:G-protein coupled receptor [Citrus sinensis]|uniref:G-protein coupled receptor n=1 Tax=Citrus sinensis TaxID=2711 RepID=A0ACB8J0V7_CITSI|nr:G-protein coupled receptor [Citrus sinensis]
MRSEGCHLKASLLDYLLILVTAVVLQGLGTVAVAVPRSKCYALDNSSRIVDFSSWIGLPFEYEDKDSDLVIRFCKDVERRSQMGYVDFGRFDGFNGFVAGSGHVDFVQGFYNGDLLKCEDSYDKRGRTAQVNIICGNCSNGQCKGLAFVELAIPCEKPGPRVFEGFTVGFNPRSSEIVYNGMTQIGFEMSHHEFRTEQINVALYISAIASVSTLVRKPSFKVSPEKGLNVKLSGSGATGSPPTTLSPTVLIVDWRCEKAHSMPFEVNITIPIEGYEPVQFFLTKMCVRNAFFYERAIREGDLRQKICWASGGNDCSAKHQQKLALLQFELITTEYRQDQGGDSARGWATFGVISCMYEIPTQFLSLKFIVASALFCCGGFIYKTRVERVHGIDALPGMTILSACLETVSGAGQSYPRAEDLNGGFTNEASWEHHPAAAQGTRTTSERKYGSI